MSDISERAAVARNFDLQKLPADFYDNPYVYYSALREHEPVKRLPNGSYLLTRYDDVLAVYKNPALFSSDKKAEFAPKFGNSLLFEHHTTSLVFNDPPLHTRVRRLIAGALTPRAIEGMRAGLVATVERLLDAMAEKPSVDLIADFAAAIPVEIIGNLLAVPIDERGPLRGWSLAILGALEPAVTPEILERGNTALAEFLSYLEGLVARRRAMPGDPERDVLTRLIQGEAGGERLSEKELLHNCVFLLNAGHETTTNLIGNALVALAQHPSEKAKLTARPELVKTAVEEVLRLESSNQLGNRITTATAIVGGVELPAGTQITLCIAAANRDPAQFPEPERFDVARDPNRHLAFAAGIHQCAGMSLARLEGAVALNALLARFPNYRLIGEPVRGRRARFRGFVSIPAELRG